MSVRFGYTLIELMVVVALLAILVVSVMGMFLTLLRSGGATGAMARVKQEGDYATITMERIIRGGKGYSTCDNAQNPPLVFTIPNPAGGADLTNTVRLVGSQIVLNDGTDKYLTSTKVQVSGLSFVCIQKKINHGATVTVTFNMIAPGLNQAEPFKSTVIMRNY